MRFVVDESVDAPVYEALRSAGHEVYAVIENCPRCSDEDVLQIAFERLAILITQDKDFGELSFRMRKPHHGIVLLRLSGGPAVRKAEITVSVVRQH